MRTLLIPLGILILFAACKKSQSPAPVPPAPPAYFSFNSLKVNGAYSGLTYYNVSFTPVIQLSFSAPLDHNSVTSAISLQAISGGSVAYTTTYTNNDSTVSIKPSSSLQPIPQ